MAGANPKIPGGSLLTHSPHTTRRGTEFQNRQRANNNNNDREVRQQPQAPVEPQAPELPQAPALVQPQAPVQPQVPELPQAPALVQPPQAPEPPRAQRQAGEVPPVLVPQQNQIVQPPAQDQAFVTLETFQHFQNQFAILTNVINNLAVNVDNLRNMNQNNLQQNYNDNNLQQQVNYNRNNLQPLNNVVEQAAVANPIPIQPAQPANLNQPPNPVALQIPNPVLYRDNVDIKFHPFMKQNPNEWFEMLEQRFIARNVFADHDRYFNVIKNLPPDVLAKVEFLLKSLPPQDKYETLKRALIEKFSTKEETRINNFLNNTSMGTLTPSEFLEYLKATGNGFFPRNSILRVWLERLPNSISLLLDSDINVNNEHIFVRKADTIFEKLNKDKITSVNAVSSQEQIISNKLENLESKLEKFCSNICSISNSKNKNSSRAHSPFHSRSRDRSRHGSRDRSRDNSRHRFREESRDRVEHRSRNRNRDSPQYRDKYRSHDRSRNRSRDDSRLRYRDRSRDGSRENYRDKSRDKSRERSRERSPFNPPDSPYCQYHLQYGNSARKCSPPCAWEFSQPSRTKLRSKTPPRPKNYNHPS